MRKSRIRCLSIMSLPARTQDLQGATGKRVKNKKTKKEENDRLVIGHEQKQLRLTSPLLRKWRRIRQKQA